ncbi:MAG: hypothetical protein ACLGG7_04820 [Bacteriovoracia bacterium]
MRILYVLLSVLSLDASAQMALERLCFDSTEATAAAMPVLKPIIVKDVDTVTLEDTCLNVSIEEARVELFDRWVRLRLPHAQRAFSSVNAPRPACEMLVTKITDKAEKTQGGSVNRRGFAVGAGEAKSELREQNFLKVLSGGTVQLTVDESKLEITCTVRGETYHLKIAALYTPKPILPPGTVVPPGTIVVVPGPPPADQSGTSLQTEIETQAGVDVDLGKITRDLTSQQKDISLNPSGRLESTTGAQNTRWVLRISSQP